MVRVASGDNSTLITVDSKDVDMSLAKLNFLLSSDGLTIFLASTIAPYLQKRAAERFQGGGDDVVGKWAPLKPATIGFREEAGFPGATPINKRTGELENWVVGDNWRAYPRTAGSTLMLPGKKPTGELKKKMETAQKGRKLAPKTVPRPVIGLNEKDLLFTMTALSLAIDQAMK